MKVVYAIEKFSHISGNIVKLQYIGDVNLKHRSNLEKNVVHNKKTLKNIVVS